MAITLVGDNLASSGTRPSVGTVWLKVKFVFVKLTLAIDDCAEVYTDTAPYFKITDELSWEIVALYRLMSKRVSVKFDVSWFVHTHNEYQIIPGKQSPAFPSAMAVVGKYLLVNVLTYICNWVIVLFDSAWFVVVCILIHDDDSLIARFVVSTWGPSGADRTQVGPMLAPWTLLSGLGRHRGQSWNQDQPLTLTAHTTHYSMTSWHGDAFRITYPV